MWKLLYRGYIIVDAEYYENAKRRAKSILASRQVAPYPLCLYLDEENGEILDAPRENLTGSCAKAKLKIKRKPIKRYFL